MQPRDNQQGPSPSDANLLQCSIAFSDLFDDIDRYDRPEEDVRHRYLRLRAVRARFVEGLMNNQERAWKELQDQAKDLHVPSDNGGLEKRYEEAMINLDKALRWYSRVNDEDTKAANAPVVDQYFMDEGYRYFLDKPDKFQRAPNGNPRSLYGSKGEPVPPSLMAIRGCDNNFIRDLILQRLLRPINHHVVVRFHTFCMWLLGRDTTLSSQGFSGGTLDVLVSAGELVAGVLCMSGSVGILYNITSMKARLIVATVLSLALPLLVVFLSKEAIRLFGLIAMIWAIFIVFISTANYNL